MKVMLIVNTDGALYRFRKPIIKALIDQKHEVVTLSSESTYFESLIAMGARPRSLEFFRHSTSMLRNFVLGARIYRSIKQETPDVVHSFTHKPAIFGSIAAWLNKTPGIFVTITGLGTIFSNDDFKSKILRVLLLFQYRIALRFVTNVYFQNPDDMGMFLKKKIVAQSKAILTNGSGIDLSEFAMPSAEEVEISRRYLGKCIGTNVGARKVILFTARGVREKGFFDFYEAARRVNMLEPDKYIFVHLGLIDTASSGFISNNDVSEYARECGVSYLGFVENVRDYIIASDIMVLPSVYREGTPRSLIEALALGKAIVTTDMPGCRETVIDSWNGFLCKGSDASSLTSKILMIDDAFLRNASGRSRRLCEQKYDSKLLVDTTLGRYQACLVDKRTRNTLVVGRGLNS
jgi:N,N'-diacetylbacillosaminyl-diphospho-undecaprenol alpha-1,3-N-acetylgalactosaminyltransferase